MEVVALTNLMVFHEQPRSELQPGSKHTRIKRCAIFFPRKQKNYSAYFFISVPSGAYARQIAVNREKQNDQR